MFNYHFVCKEDKLKLDCSDYVKVLVSVYLSKDVILFTLLYNYFVGYQCVVECVCMCVRVCLFVFIIHSSADLFVDSLIDLFFCCSWLYVNSAVGGAHARDPSIFRGLSKQTEN